MAEYGKPRPELQRPLDSAVAPAIRTVAPRPKAGGSNNAGGSYLAPQIWGSYYLWIDTTGDMRIKSSAPTSDLDGTVVGTQS